MKELCDAEKMSVYGGDSWAADAHSRKRRIDLLLSDQLGSKSQSHRKLANGQFVCRVCPNRPVLDTLPMLTMHNQGARHQAAASKLKEKEIRIQEEINKRIALSEACISNTDASNNPVNSSGFFKCPLLEKTRKGTAIAHANGKNALGNTLTPTGDHNVVSGKKPFFASLHAKNINISDQKTDSAICHPEPRSNGFSKIPLFVQNDSKVISNLAHEQQSDLQTQKDRELKFRAAGWCRDGRGGWFREENVEFDSDEEDPNVTFGSSCQ